MIIAHLPNGTEECIWVKDDICRVDGYVFYVDDLEVLTSIIKVHVEDKHVVVRFHVPDDTRGRSCLVVPLSSLQRCEQTVITGHLDVPEGYELVPEMWTRLFDVYQSKALDHLTHADRRLDL